MRQARIWSVCVVAVMAWASGGPATAAPTRQHVVDLPDVQIAYRERGQGRPVVFLHALLTDSRLWLDQLDELCAQRRCLAPDFSGHGFSSPLTQSKVDSRRYAREFLAFLDALGVREPVDVVGLSGGGNIAVLACAESPGRCRSITLISAVIGAGSLDAAGIRYRAENARTVVIEGKDTLFRRFNEYIVGPSASLTARARYRSMLEQTPYESFVAFLTTAETPPDPKQLLPKITMPVMIPVGAGDTVLTPEMAKKSAAALPDGRVVELASAGRLLPIEAPRELNAALRTFWSELDQRGP